MNIGRKWLWLLAACLLGACGRSGEGGADGAGPGAQGVPPGFGQWFGQDVEHTWAGLLPCSDCPGVDTRLVLRTKGKRRTYLMTETYLGSIGNNSFTSAGTWIETSGRLDGQTVPVYILDPDKGGQRYALQPDGALEAMDGNGKPWAQGLAYRLQRL